MSTALAVGSRLPAFHTSLGRAQLGYLDGAEIWRRLRSATIEAYTPYTITDMQALFDRVCADREQGFSIVDEELERGLRSIAVPVLDRTGQAVGAINLSAHATRTTRNEMREKFLPELKAIAQRISQTPRRSDEATFVRVGQLVRRAPKILSSRFAFRTEFGYRTLPCGDQKRSNSTGGHNGKSDDDQDGRRQGSHGKAGENQRRQRPHRFRAAAGKYRPDASYQAADRRGVYRVAARRPRGLHLWRTRQGRHNPSRLPQHRTDGGAPVRRAA